jgi:pyridoxamine 5'-phosphate oxidase
LAAIRHQFVSEDPRYLTLRGAGSSPRTMELHSNPIVQFDTWYRQAQSAWEPEAGLLSQIKGVFRYFFRQIMGFMSSSGDIVQPNAVALATASPEGKPSVRFVLYKGRIDEGFVFYTNYDSPKARELSTNPQAEMVFFWNYPIRQVRVFGSVEKITYEQSDRYWQSRPRGSQLAGMTSPQSQVISGREELEVKMKQFEKDFEGKTIPCPQNWGGFRLVPERMEFWQGRAFRFHDRFIYEKNGNDWQMQRLAP